MVLYISDKFDFLVVKGGPQDLEFLLVSVFTANNANKKLLIGLWHQPPSDSSSIDILHSALETLEPSVFFYFVLLGDDFYNPQHPLYQI